MTRSPGSSARSTRRRAGALSLVGLSLGGYVAMAVAGRHPETRPRPGHRRIHARARRARAGSPSRLYAADAPARRPSPPCPAPRARLVPAPLRRGPGAPPSPPAATSPSGGARPSGSIAGRASAIGSLAYGGPILVINGTLDLVFRIGAGRFLAGVPGVTHRVIPRAGHLSNVDRPEVFTGLIEEFVGGAPGLAGRGPRGPGGILPAGPSLSGPPPT